MVLRLEMRIGEADEDFLNLLCKGGFILVAMVNLSFIEEVRQIAHSIGAAKMTMMVWRKVYRRQ